MDTYNAIVYLIICALKNKEPSSQTLLSIDMDKVYAYASRHMISSTIAYALIKNGINVERFKKTLFLSISKLSQICYTKNKIIQLFEEQGIWYMPLKGIILKDLYPHDAMREMSDCDILIDASRRNDVKTIMEGMGFEAEYYDVSNEDVYIKLPALNYEMHTELFKAFDDPNLYEYYKDVKSKLIKDEGNGFGYHFSDEDLYIYLIAHEFMHFTGGGTGLRSLIDTYVFLNSKSLDMSYVEEEMKKMGIADFEKKNRSLAIHLFNEEKLTDEENEMLQYILDSGTYGTLENSIRNTVKKTNNKASYIIKRITIPYSKKNPRYRLFERQYPFFYKYKVLLPFLPIYRLYNARKKTPGRIIDEIKIIKKT